MSHITVINNAPMSRLRFRDFQSLKSGRDEFSRRGLVSLRASLPGEIVAQVAAAFPDSAELQERCLRWVLRGLQTDKAVRKVKTDAEVSANAAGIRHAPYHAPERRPTIAEYLHEHGRPSDAELAEHPVFANEYFEHLIRDVAAVLGDNT
jgi:hypothetical protein